jgi:transposase-like protein
MSVMEKAARARRSFTSEFKSDAVALVIDEDRSIAVVAGPPGCINAESQSGGGPWR